MGNLGLLSILKSTWDWQTNKQTNFKITKPVGRRRDGLKVSQGCSSDRCDAFLCHEPSFMWDKLTHCGRAQCFQHLFSNSEYIVLVIYSPFIWNVIHLTHIMVNWLLFFIHIWEAVWWLGCWRTLEDCWKARLAPLASSVHSAVCVCGYVHMCVRWAKETLMESNVCVILESPKWNGVGVGGELCPATAMS